MLFAGFIGEREDGSMFVRVIEPPKPVFGHLYRCDKAFFIEPLVTMLKDTPKIGILSIDATEAGVGIVDGQTRYYGKVLTSGVGGKSGKGGSSARRYERDRESRLNQYYHRVADYANRYFLEVENLRELIVSGPGFTKDTFLDKGYLDYRLRAKVRTADVGYAGFEGVMQTPVDDRAAG